MTRFKALAALLALALTAYPFAKKKKEEATQTLEAPKEPPAAVTAETSRLIFQVSPLSAKGLLSQQVRDALKALLKSANGATIVKLRAFVAGSGDLRRVQAIAGEIFTERRLPLPALSVVQVGALPLAETAPAELLRTTKKLDRVVRAKRRHEKLHGAEVPVAKR